MIDTERYLPFLVRHKLTQQEFLLLFCLFQKEKTTDLTFNQNVKSYIEMFGVENEKGQKKMVGDNVRDSLVKKGFLEEVNGKYQTTALFQKHFVDQYDAITELYEAYPGFIIVKNQKFPSKGGNVHENAKEYWRSIKGSAEAHRKVLEAIEYGVKNNLICSNVTNFIHAKAWTDIRKLMSTGKSETANMTSIIPKDF